MAQARCSALWEVAKEDFLLVYIESRVTVPEAYDYICAYTEQQRTRNGIGINTRILNNIP